MFIFVEWFFMLHGPMACVKLMLSKGVMSPNCASVI